MIPPQILQLSTYHPEHGIVLASPYAQFDGTRFWDAGYVREYRKLMLKSVAHGTPGFGLLFGRSAETVSIGWKAENEVVIKFMLQNDVSLVLSSRLLDGELVQSAL
jgi:hypothetical protein